MTVNFGMDIGSLTGVYCVFEHLGCPKCQSVGLRLEETLKQGMAFKFELHCKSKECLWYHTFLTVKGIIGAIKNG